MKPLTITLLVSLVLIAAGVFSIRFLLKPPSDRELISILKMNRERFDRLSELLVRTEDLERSGFTVYQQVDASAANASQPDRHPEWSEGDIRKMLSDLGAVELAIWPNRMAMMYFYRHPGLIEGIAFWPMEARSRGPEMLTQGFENVENKPGIYIEPIDEKWCVFAYRTD